MLSAVPCVGVSSSPCVGLPSFPCAGTGGRWARPGVVCAPSGLGCGGAFWRAGASGVVRLVPQCGCSPWGSRGADWVGVRGPVWCAPPAWCASSGPSWRSLPQCRGCWPFLFPVLVVHRCFLAPVFCCPWCPVPVGACLLPWTSPCPLAAGVPFALSLSSVLVVEWCRGLWGADGPCPVLGGLEPPAEGFGGVEVAEAPDRVPKEGFRCPLRRRGLGGGVGGVGGDAGEDFLESVGGVTPFTPSRSPCPLYPADELPQGRGRPPGEVGGGQGGGGLRARCPGAALAGAWGGGCVSSARAKGSTVPFVEGGGRGPGTVVARVVAFGRAGAAVTGAGAGGCVSVARRTGSAVPSVGGGRRGHGTVVAPVVGAEGARPWGVLAAPRGAVRVSG